MFGDIMFGFDPQLQGLYNTTGRVFLQKPADQEQYDFDFMGSDRHGESTEFRQHLLHKIGLWNPMNKI